MPDGRYGAWAAIWFLQEGVPSGVEIDLAQFGFLNKGTPNTDNVTQIYTRGNKEVDWVTPVDVSLGYHIYGMEYRPGKSIKMYFDNKLMMQTTTGVPTGAFEMIFVNDMADPSTAGWHTLPGTQAAPYSMMGQRRPALQAQLSTKARRSGPPFLVSTPLLVRIGCPAFRPFSGRQPHAGGYWSGDGSSLLANVHGFHLPLYW